MSRLQLEQLSQSINLQDSPDFPTASEMIEGFSDPIDRSNRFFVSEEGGEEFRAAFPVTSGRFFRDPVREREEQEAYVEGMREVLNGSSRSLDSITRDNFEFNIFRSADAADPIMLSIPSFPQDSLPGSGLAFLQQSTTQSALSLAHPVYRLEEKAFSYIHENPEATAKEVRVFLSESMRQERLDFQRENSSFLSGAWFDMVGYVVSPSTYVTPMGILGAAGRGLSIAGRFVRGSSAETISFGVQEFGLSQNQMLDRNTGFIEFATAGAFGGLFNIPGRRSLADLPIQQRLQITKRVNQEKGLRTALDPDRATPGANTSREARQAEAAIGAQENILYEFGPNNEVAVRRTNASGTADIEVHRMAADGSVTITKTGPDGAVTTETLANQFPSGTDTVEQVAYADSLVHSLRQGTEVEINLGDFSSDFIAVHSTLHSSLADLDSFLNIPVYAHAYGNTGSLVIAQGPEVFTGRSWAFYLDSGRHTPAARQAIEAAAPEARHVTAAYLELEQIFNPNQYQARTEIFPDLAGRLQRLQRMATAGENIDEALLDIILSFTPLPRGVTRASLLKGLRTKTKSEFADEIKERAVGLARGLGRNKDAKAYGRPLRRPRSAPHLAKKEAFAQTQLIHGARTKLKELLEDLKIAEALRFTEDMLKRYPFLQDELVDLDSLQALLRNINDNPDNVGAMRVAGQILDEWDNHGLASVPAEGAVNTQVMLRMYDDLFLFLRNETQLDPKTAQAVATSRRELTGRAVRELNAEGPPLFSREIFRELAKGKFKKVFTQSIWQPMLHGSLAGKALLRNKVRFNEFGGSTFNRLVATFSPLPNAADLAGIERSVQLDALLATIKARMARLTKEIQSIYNTEVSPNLSTRIQSYIEGTQVPNSHAEAQHLFMTKFWNHVHNKTNAGKVVDGEQVLEGVEAPMQRMLDLWREQNPFDEFQDELVRYGLVSAEDIARATNNGQSAYIHHFWNARRLKSDPELQKKWIDIRVEELTSRVERGVDVLMTPEKALRQATREMAQIIDDPHSPRFTISGTRGRTTPERFIDIEDSSLYTEFMHTDIGDVLFHYFSAFLRPYAMNKTLMKEFGLPYDEFIQMARLQTMSGAQAEKLGHGALKRKADNLPLVLGEEALSIARARRSNLEQRWLEALKEVPEDGESPSFLEWARAAELSDEEMFLVDGISVRTRDFKGEFRKEKVFSPDQLTREYSPLNAVKKAYRREYMELWGLATSEADKAKIRTEIESLVADGAAMDILLDIAQGTPWMNQGSPTIGTIQRAMSNMVFFVLLKDIVFSMAPEFASNTMGGYFGGSGGFSRWLRSLVPAITAFDSASRKRLGFIIDAAPAERTFGSRPDEELFGRQRTDPNVAPGLQRLERTTKVAADLGAIGSGMRPADKVQRISSAQFAEAHLANVLPRIVAVLDDNPNFFSLTKDKQLGLLRQEGFTNPNDFFLVRSFINTKNTRKLLPYLTEGQGGGMNHAYIDTFQMAKDRRALREAGNFDEAQALLDAQYASEGFIFDRVTTMTGRPGEFDRPAFGKEAAVNRLLNSVTGFLASMASRRIPQLQTRAGGVQAGVIANGMAWSSVAILLRAVARGELEETLADMETPQGLAHHLTFSFLRVGFPPAWMGLLVNTYFHTEGLEMGSVPFAAMSRLGSGLIRQPLEGIYDSLVEGEYDPDKFMGAFKVLPITNSPLIQGILENLD